MSDEPDEPVVAEMLDDEYGPPDMPETPAAFKVGRNERCPCGSGLKYKKCCGKEA